MTEFLLELYIAKTDCGVVTAAVARLCRAAAQLTAGGTSVRIVRSIFVAEDETCFVLVEAETAEAVLDAARHAEVSFERRLLLAQQEFISHQRGPTSGSAHQRFTWAEVKGLEGGLNYSGIK